MAFRPERRSLTKGPAETGVGALRPFNGGAEPPRLHAVQAGTPERRVSQISSAGGQFLSLSGTTGIGTSPMKRASRPGLLGVVLAAVFAAVPASAANPSSVSVVPRSVTLASNNAAAVVPAGVTVAGGAKTATFAITTTSVTNATIPVASSGRQKPGYVRRSAKYVNVMTGDSHGSRVIRPISLEPQLSIVLRLAVQRASRFATRGGPYAS
jgi:hypothetical protein